MLVVTTNAVEGRTVTRYHGIVSVNIVAGTGFFSDFAAGLSDIFGGRSGTYQRHLDQLNNEALSALGDKARKTGANAVIGTQIDYDEISGKGTQMFMVTARGTAVSLSGAERGEATPDNGTREDLEAHLMSSWIDTRIAEGQIDSALLGEAVKYRLSGYGPRFVKTLSKRNAQSYWSAEEIEALTKYLDSTDAEELDKTLVTWFDSFNTEHSELNHALMKWYRTRGDYSYASLLKVLKTAPIRARPLLTELVISFPASISAQAAVDAVDLANHIDTAASVAEQKDKSGVFGKTSSVWICPTCHAENSIEADACARCSCDTAGFKPDRRKLAVSRLRAVESYFDR